MVKAGIITFLGTNCEIDTKRACEFFGWETELIFQEESIKKNYDVIFLPGGFAHGDHISSGRIAKLSPAVKSLPVGKSLIVGICNGFQILTEAKLLSGALTHNENLKFISKVIPVKFQNETLNLPIAHHQGNYTGLGNEEVILRYCKNVNGSDDFIAGIYDKKNRIMGMMPHPERAVFEQLGLTDGRKIFEFIEKEAIRKL